MPNPRSSFGAYTAIALLLAVVLTGCGKASGRNTSLLTSSAAASSKPACAPVVPKLFGEHYLRLASERRSSYRIDLRIGQRLTIYVALDCSDRSWSQSMQPPGVLALTRYQHSRQGSGDVEFSYVGRTVGYATIRIAYTPTCPPDRRCAYVPPTVMSIVTVTVARPRR